MRFALLLVECILSQFSVRIIVFVSFFILFIFIACALTPFTSTSSILIRQFPKWSNKQYYNFFFSLRCIYAWCKHFSFIFLPDDFFCNEMPFCWCFCLCKWFYCFCCWCCCCILYKCSVQCAPKRYNESITWVTLSNGINIKISSKSNPELFQASRT